MNNMHPSADAYASPFWWLQAITVATVLLRAIGFYLTWLRLDDIDANLEALSAKWSRCLSTPPSSGGENSLLTAHRPARWLAMKRRRQEQTSPLTSHWMSPSEADPTKGVKGEDAAIAQGPPLLEPVAPSGVTTASVDASQDSRHLSDAVSGVPES